MAKGKLTQRAVEEAKPASKKYIIWDEKLTGFGLKVTPAGKKVYVFQYRLAVPGAASKTPPRLFTIGSHGSPWTAATAREEAGELAILVKRGIDPVEDFKKRLVAQEAKKRAEIEQTRLEKELRFDIVSDRWLSTLVQNGKSQKYHDTCRWAVRRYLVPVLGWKPITQISPEDIQEALDKIPTEKSATPIAVFDTAFAVFQWARGTKAGRLVRYNVVAEVDRPMKPEGRKRVLSDNELALVWHASEALGTVWKAFFRIAILTGKRRTEISNMHWSELDAKRMEWLIASDRTKNRKADLVSLNEPVLALIDEIALQKSSGDAKANSARDLWFGDGYVMTKNGEAPIGNFSKVKAKLDREIRMLNEGAAIPHWTVHDIRRTLGTGMQRLGVPLEVIKAVLAHRIPSGASRDYLHHQWREEKMEARQLWADHVLSIISRS